MNPQILLKYSKAWLLCFTLLHIATQTHAKKVRVLFIGNSYTYFNDLPQMIADMAASTGDTLEYDTSTPGGANFNNHAAHIPITTTKIKAGGWDYVVLQEQSQMPAHAPNYFFDWGYRFAEMLVDTIRHYNPCAKPIFYMTWGRKNGDMSLCPRPIFWRAFCSYHTMDSVIRSRYMLMTDSMKATVSPVGAVWRVLRIHHPSIELYNADESHPSFAGSYAGACSFYTTFFGKPADSLRLNFTLPATDAAIIRKAATQVVYDSMAFWHIGQYDITAGFTHNASGMSPVSFTNSSVNATAYAWDFGDGNTTTAANPTHTYTAPGTYTVRMIATGAHLCNDTSYATLILKSTGITNVATQVFSIAPNPGNGNFIVKLKETTSSETVLRVYDMMGKQVHIQQLPAHTGSTNLQLQHLPKGSYHVALQTSHGMAAAKLVIE